MTYKFHLTAITGIVLSVLLFWHFFKPPPAEVNIVPVDTSGIAISIVRAAINSTCKPAEELSETTTSDGSLKEKVAYLCDGKKECSIAVETAFAAENLPANCTRKSLMVEYRCFAFDRLHVVQAGSGNLLVKCELTAQPQP